MKCPRCKTENDMRTICKKCGLFLYHSESNNKIKMTRSQRAKEDAKIVGKKLRKILSYVWLVIMMVVLSGLFIYLMLIVTGGGGGFGG